MRKKIGKNPWLPSRPKSLLGESTPWGKHDARKANSLNTSGNGLLQPDNSRQIEISNIGPPNPNVQKPTLTIEEIENEGELLQALREGHIVRAYRGFDSRFLPTIGETYDRPFGGDEAGQKHTLTTNPFELAIETIRREHFPDCPSRVTSIFIAPSSAEAQKWGRVYEVEIRLKSPSRQSQISPLRWLDRTFFETITRLFHPDMDLGEIVKNHAGNIRNYLSLRGSHEKPADILIDPNQIELTVVKEYIPSDAEKIKEALEGIFTNDPMGFRPPEDLEDLVERLEEIEKGFNPEAFATLKSKAVKRLIEKLRGDLPRISSGKILCHAFDIPIDKGGEFFNSAIYSIEECLNTEPKPYQESDPEYQDITFQLQKIKEAIIKTGHFVYLSYLFELGAPRDGILMGLEHYLSWEERYGIACQIAGISPNISQIDQIRENYVTYAGTELIARLNKPIGGQIDHYDLEKMNRCLEILSHFGKNFDPNEIIDMTNRIIMIIKTG